MTARTIVFDGTFAAWREHARALAAAHVPPTAVRFVDRQLDDAATDSLFGDAPLTPLPPAAAPLHVPRAFMSLAADAARFRDRRKWATLYRLLHRLTHGQRDLLDDVMDDDVHAVQRMAKAVRRDAHKMRAFVRFCRVDDDAAPAGERYVAWYRPDHLVVDREARFFRERFASMCWSILTPDRCVHWDTHRLTFTPGLPLAQRPADADYEQLWRTYYAATFNPARVNPRAMTAEMPRRHWSTLPETTLIPELLAGASGRCRQMQEHAMAQQAATAAPYVPDSTSLPVLAEAVQACRGCPLWEPATHAVFGEGLKKSRVVLVGEQPGDQEDLAGKPFVGPAGQQLDALMDEAGLDRQLAYVTNTVKHFKFELRGKRRIHSKPGLREISACMPWLEAELAAIKPSVVVALGATAAQALMGRDFRITRQRGEVQETRFAPHTLATYHPSALLRAPDETRAREIHDAMVQDLALAAKLMTPT